MKKWILTALLMGAASMAGAGTDYQCLNDCTRQGYQYGYCQSKCSFDSGSQPQQIQPQRIPQTDYKCLSDCTAKGYLYQYCQNRCSF